MNARSKLLLGLALVATGMTAPAVAKKGKGSARTGVSGQFGRAGQSLSFDLQALSGRRHRDPRRDHL